MRRWLTLAALVIPSGCAMPDARTPSFVSEGAGLPLLVPDKLAGTAELVEEPPAAPKPRPRAPTLEGSCATKLLLPTHLGGPIGDGLRGVLTEASAPTSRAICACVRRAASVRLVVIPDYGELQATTGDASTDACLSASLGRDRFTRVHFGSDCIHCGPQRFPLWHDSVPRDADEPEDGVSTVVLSFFFEPAP